MVKNDLRRPRHLLRLRHERDVGYAGIAVLMGIESACIPLPSELIMPYAGAMSIPRGQRRAGAPVRRRAPAVQPRSSPRSPARSAATSAARSPTGSARRAAARRSRSTGATSSSASTSSRSPTAGSQKRGDIIILVARLLPVIRTFIAFPAGVARMNRVKFHVYTFVGLAPVVPRPRLVGQQLGQELMSETSPLKHFMHRFDAVIAVGRRRRRRLVRALAPEGAEGATARTTKRPRRRAKKARRRRRAVGRRRGRLTLSALRASAFRARVHAWRKTSCARRKAPAAEGPGGVTSRRR